MQDTPQIKHNKKAASKEIDLQTNLTSTLLHEQLQHLHQLKTCYSQLTHQITRRQSLIQQKRSLQLNRNNIVMLSAEERKLNSKLLMDKQNQCAQKEQLLKNVKQEMIGNAMSATSINKKNQSLKKHNLQLEQEYQRIRANNNQKRRLLNQLETQIKDTTTVLGHQRRTQLKLKQQLADIRLNPPQHSHYQTSIVQQIHHQLDLSNQMGALMHQLCQL